MTVFNPGIHLHLLDLGFEYEHMEADWADIGTGETGPWLTGGPAYDCYVHNDWDMEIAVDADGSVHVMEYPSGTMAYLEEMN